MARLRPPLAAWLAAALWLGAGGARAQEPAASPEASPTATPLSAIPDAEIPSEADQALADLRRAEGTADPVPEIEAVADSMSREGPAIRERLAALTALDPERVSTGRVADERIAWNELSARVARWAARLEERWKALQQRRDQLGRRRRQWEETRRSARSADMPVQLVQRIDDVLAAIGSSEGCVRERADAIARLNDRVAGLRSVVQAARDRLDVLGGRVRDRLLVRDAPPLWRAAVGRSDALSEQARRARRYWLDTLLDWSSPRLGLLLALLGLFAAALVAALALRNRSRSWPASAKLEAARALVERPVAAATAFALLGLALAQLELPSSVRDVVFALSLFPVISLGSVLCAPVLRRFLYRVAALSLVERISALGPDGSLLRRLLVLAVAALGAAGALLLVRRWKRAGAAAGWRQAVIVALRVAAALLLVSAVANALGWLTLAESLASATLVTGFSAVAWLVAARAAQALVPLVSSGAPGRWLPSLQRHAPRVEATACAAISVVAVVLWARVALQRFQLWDPLARGLGALLTAPLAVGGLEFSAGRVLSALLVLLLAVPLSRLVRAVLREEVLPRVSLPAGADNTVLTLSHYALLAGAVALAAGVAGIGSTELTLVVGALGVGIGFGLQNIVNNFVSGLILIFERPIKVGDRIETGTHLGVVSRIGIRASTVRTYDGAEVIVPNGDLISKELSNWTLSDQVRRIDLRVGVAYGSDPRRVLELLKRCAASHPRILPEPEPAAVMVGFGDSSLDFRLLAWVSVEVFLEVTSDLHVAVNDALAEAGIEIPFPQRDLHVRSFSGPVPLADRGPGGSGS